MFCLLSDSVSLLDTQKLIELDQALVWWSIKMQSSVYENSLFHLLSAEDASAIVIGLSVWKLIHIIIQHESNSLLCTGKTQGILTWKREKKNGGFQNRSEKIVQEPELKHFCSENQDRKLCTDPSPFCLTFRVKYMSTKVPKLDLSQDKSTTVIY